MRRTWTVALCVVAVAGMSSIAGAQDVKETAHLVVKGGAQAGTYDAVGTRGGCSAGLTGAGSWGNQLSSPLDKDPKKFNSLQLIVPDAKAAAAGAKEFQLIVGFGPLMARTATYEVDTRKDSKAKKGSGVVTVKDAGATARVTFAATTADGVSLEGTIDCKSVTRAN